MNNADDIRNLSAVEAMRIMPGMYIGGTDQRALHELFFEAVGDAIEEVFNRPDAHIEIIIGKRITVSDNGEGYSLDIDKPTEQPMLERIVTSIHSPHRKYLHTSPYHFHGGVGIAVVNGLSSEFIIQTKQQGYLWRQTYEAGQKTSEVEAIRELGDREETGTIRTFRPDFTIFEQNELDHQYIRRRLREYAFLIPGLTISFEDKRRSIKHKREVFHHTKGVQDFIRFVNRDVRTLHPALIISGEMELEPDNGQNRTWPFLVEIALQFTDAPQSPLPGFVNAFEIVDGGEHIEGLIAGIGKHLEPCLQDKEIPGNKWVKFSHDDIYGTLTAVISMWYSAPAFEGAVTHKMTNPEVFHAIRELVSKEFGAFTSKHPEYLEAIMQQCIKNRDARLQRRYGD